MIMSGGKPLLIAWCCIGTAAWQREVKKIKISYPAVSYKQIHIWVAKDAGLFHKHGLDRQNTDRFHRVLSSKI
jgi:hypothetical protein